jgi:hypothetical protein
MKAISMWQPHGSLLTTGAKPFETRGWKTNFRGPVLIHAALRCPQEEIEFFLRRPAYQCGLAPLVGLPMDWEHRATLGRVVKIEDIPFGAFIGMGELIDCIPTEKLTQRQLWRSRGFGDFLAGRFAWEFTDVKRFKTPIPGKGHQGFFYASADLSGNELIPG